MKKFLLVNFIISLLLVNVVFATAIGVDVMPNGGPGAGPGAGSVVGQNDAVIEFKQYDLSEKFVYVMDNGCRVECPKNVNTNNGMVTTKDYNVVQSTYDGSWYFEFDYTGLKSKYTKFYIKSKNAEGLMVDLKEVNIGYSSEYNERNGKIKYKAVTESMSYKIPASAVSVEVVGILESY